MNDGAIPTTDEQVDEVTIERANEITIAEILETIQTALWNEVDDPCMDGDNRIALIESYESAGVLTMDEGLLVRTEDGVEFQITVTRQERRW